MKSGYYLATVVNAYRRFMDGGALDLSERELCAVAHRDYTAAYALRKNSQTVNYTDSQSRGEYTYIADILDYKDGLLTVEMRNRFKTGDCLEILSPESSFGKSFTVEEIFLKGERTDDAKLVQGRYSLPCPYPAKAGGFLRKRG
jgi:putative protease